MKHFGELSQICFSVKWLHLLTHLHFLLNHIHPEFYPFDLKSRWHLIVFLQLSLVPLKVLISVQTKKDNLVDFTL